MDDMTEQSGSESGNTLQSGNTLLTKEEGASLAAADTPGPSGPEERISEPQVPDTYELKVPEGVELDREMFDRATPVFKELKLTGEQAQKLSDLYATRMAESNKAQFDAWNATQDGWRKAASADSEIGGSRFVESVSLAKVALKRFGSPELKKDMDQYGMGNHPEMIRLLCRVGLAMQQDKLLAGERGVEPVEPGKILYPNMD